MNKRTTSEVTAISQTARPALGTLGDVLKETVNHQVEGVTKITGSSASRWYELNEGEPDKHFLEIEGATACLEAQTDVCLFIRQGVTVSQARALLKAICKELKQYSDLERFTPLERVSDDSLPF
jgi:hypothetical protein